MERVSPHVWLLLPLKSTFGIVSKEADMTPGMRHCLWIVLAAGCVFFLNLGVPQLWDEDEPKNAACAREMLERNDWVVPMFNYELRTAKPVLVYWFMMSAYELFGVSEFGARFWSAVMGIGTCLLTYGIGRRLFGPTTGLWAALMLAAALMFGVASRAATPDAPLIFFSTLALAIFVWGLPPAALNSSLRQSTQETAAPTDHLRQFIPQTWSTYFWMYATMGVAVLAKGPVGVVLPTLIIMGYLWQRRPTTCSMPQSASGTWRGRLWHGIQQVSPVVIWRVGWVLRPLTALVVVAIVAVPWYVWVGWRTDGAWIAGFLGKHNVTRFVQPLEGHSGPVFYYLLAVMLGFFPWSIFLPLACVRLFQRLRRTESWTVGDAFCASWAVIYIGFFSLASTKLPSYVLPAYPALALITARWLTEWLKAPLAVPNWLVRGGFFNLSVVGILFVVGAPLAVMRFLPGQWYLGWAGIILLVGGVGAYRQCQRQNFERAAQTFAATALLFTMTLFGIVAVQVNPHQTSSLMMSRIYNENAAPALASFDYFEPSLAYYAQRPVHRLKTAEQAVQFLQQYPDAFVFTRDKHRSYFETKLGNEIQVLTSRPRFLKSGEVLVFSRTSASGLDVASKASPKVIVGSQERTANARDSRTY